MMQTALEIARAKAEKQLNRSQNRLSHEQVVALVVEFLNSEKNEETVDTQLRFHKDAKYVATRVKNVIRESFNGLAMASDYEDNLYLFRLVGEDA